MGCVLSNPTQTEAARRARKTIEIYQEDNAQPVVEVVELEDQLMFDVSKILQGLSQILVPEGVCPVICLAENAHPLFITTFQYEQTQDTINLPIVCLSRISNGRFIYIGSIDFLAPSILHNTETSAFLENLVSWSADYKLQSIKITLLGFSSTLISSLQGSFNSYGYGLEIPRGPPKILLSTLVFMTSNYYCDHLEDLIMDYVNRGGTVIVFANQVNSDTDNGLQAMNVLKESGLAFAKSNLYQHESIVFSSTMEYLHSFSFPNMLQRYFDIIHNAESIDDIDIHLLDDTISQLRYYVNSMNEFNEKAALELYHESLDFFEKVGYITESNEFCPHVVHNMITVILSELIHKFAPMDIVPAPHIDIFPGICEEPPYKSRIKLRLSVKPHSWNSTGLWLPPGVVATVETDIPATIQVGSHSVCLLVKQGPWKRWPSVVSRFFVVPNQETEIATPFGGIVYVINDKLKPIHLTFKNVARYSFYISHKPNLWDQTKNYKAPWSEIQMKTAIFTLPTEYLKKIDDLGSFCNIYDQLIAETYTFIGIKVPEGKRVVFDVDFPENSQISTITHETFVFTVDYLNDLINYRQVNAAIVTFLTRLALSNIDGSFYDSTIESTLSTLAACYAVKKVWPDESPLLAIPGKISNLFYDLFVLCCETGLTSLGAPIQAIILNKSITNAHDAWVSFVRRLEKLFEKSLPNLMDRFRQAGKLYPNSAESLDAYQIEECDL